MLTPLKTDSLNPLYTSPLPLLSYPCVEQEEAKWQNEEEISELQVVINSSELLLLEVDWQEVQRKSVAFLLTGGTHMNTHVSM